MSPRLYLEILASAMPRRRSPRARSARLLKRLLDSSPQVFLGLSRAELPGDLTQSASRTSRYLDTPQKIQEGTVERLSGSIRRCLSRTGVREFGGPSSNFLEGVPS